MLIGLAIRDLVLIEGLDLAFGPGLTALTGETGAGKSIILGALGLAIGGRAEAAMVRQGAPQAAASAVFAPAAGHPVWALLEEKGLACDLAEDLVLRRTLAADGRSRAFVNDEAVSVGFLKELGAQLVEVHGQHETVGLLDPRSHRPLLDAYGGCDEALAACAGAWRGWRAAGEVAERLRTEAASAGHRRGELSERLAQLDRLAPRADEEEGLAEERRLLGSAEKTLADIAAAREHLGGEEATSRAAQALRALERAAERTRAAGASADGAPMRRILAASQAADRALIELAEAAAAIDAAAEVFDFEPDRLERAEERLFALRAMARKLAVPVAQLPAERAAIAERLTALDDADARLAAAQSEALAAKGAYEAAAVALSALRAAAAQRLTAAVQAELAPLKLDKARFRVAVDPEPDARTGPFGVDRVEFEISTLPGAPFAPLAAIASGGELARLALAIKASLAARSIGPQPVLVFDEVDQGVGGAVADAVGVRLRRLAQSAQVLVVTHSPQVAARANAHWRVGRVGEGARVRADVEALDGVTREEEIARMLSGARISDAARAAARALMHA
jgi:DNA repair protein RecN (Recombination protein N)